MGGCVKQGKSTKYSTCTFAGLTFIRSGPAGPTVNSASDVPLCCSFCLCLHGNVCPSVLRDLDGRPSGSERALSFRSWLLSWHVPTTRAHGTRDGHHDTFALPSRNCKALEGQSFSVHAMRTLYGQMRKPPSQPPPPPPQGASGQPSVWGGAVGVQTRGVAPPRVMFSQKD